MDIYDELMKRNDYDRNYHAFKACCMYALCNYKEAKAEDPNSVCLRVNNDLPLFERSGFDSKEDNIRFNRWICGTPKEYSHHTPRYRSLSCFAANIQKPKRQNERNCKTNRLTTFHGLLHEQ